MKENERNIYRLFFAFTQTSALRPKNTVSTGFLNGEEEPSDGQGVWDERTRKVEKKIVPLSEVGDSSRGEVGVTFNGPQTDALWKQTNCLKRHWKTLALGV